MRTSVTIESPAAPASVTPIYTRLPKPGTRCLYTGLSRSSLCALVVPSKANGFNPPVPSHVVRGVAATRGIRLIRLDALLQHIASLAA